MAHSIALVVAFLGQPFSLFHHAPPRTHQMHAGMHGSPCIALVRTNRRRVEQR